MDEVQLTQVQDERVMTRVFRGYSRYHAAVPSKAGYTGIDLSACLNMASEEYPCASVRKARWTPHNIVLNTGEEIKYAPAKLLDAVYIDGKVAYLFADGTVMCGLKRWSAGAITQPLTKGRLYAFGAGLFVPCCNGYVPSVQEDAVRKLFGAPYEAYWDVTPTDVNGTDYPASDTAPQNPSDGDYWYCTQAGDTYGVGLYKYVVTDNVGAWTAMEYFYTKLKPVIDNTSAATILASTIPWINAVVHIQYIHKKNDYVKVLSEDTGSPKYDDIGTAKIESITHITMTESETEPVDPQNGDYWYDPATGALKQYNGSAWVSATTAAQYFIVAGTYPRKLTVKLKIDSTMPVMDHCIVHNNRVWGCRYGENKDGEFVNEIYACALGDPGNWWSDPTIADGSYTVSCGESGPWTGAAVVGDNVVFFKEHCMYTVYGETPAAYTVKVDYCSGIAVGSEKSVARIGVFTYFNSPHGVMRVASGSLPTSVSDELMYKQVLTGAVAGTDGRKYYMQATKAATRETFPQDGGAWLYVYDTELGEWHIEEKAENAVSFLPYNNELLAVCGGEEDGTNVVTMVYVSPPDQSSLNFVRMWLCRKTATGIQYPDEYISEIITIENTSSWELGPTLQWSMTTQSFGLDEPDYKRIKSIAVRAWLDDDAEMTAEIMYDDDGKWQTLDLSGSCKPGQTGTNRVEARLRRCDTYKLRFSGHGRARIYSITHTYEGDGNRSYGQNSV